MKKIMKSKTKSLSAVRTDMKLHIQDNELKLESRKTETKLSKLEQNVKTLRKLRDIIHNKMENTESLTISEIYDRLPRRAFKRR